jgi:hypothetical protein
MVSSGMLRRMALVRTDDSEELSASFIRVTTIGELGTTLVSIRSVRRLLVTASFVPSSPIFLTLMEALRFSETSVLTRDTRRNIPEDTILQILSRISEVTYVYKGTVSRVNESFRSASKMTTVAS